jgi:peptidoglycan-associated lipoprotein
MRTLRMAAVLVLGVAVIFAGFAGCGGKKQATPPTTVQQAPERQAPPVQQRQAPKQDDSQTVPSNLKFATVFFDYDKASIRADQRGNMRSNAELLKKYPSVKILVEGHCDERGSDEYNMALGQRRADTAKQYLIEYGITGSRINTVSFGESRSVDNGRNESSWAKNRRAEFVVMSSSSY